MDLIRRLQTVIPLICSLYTSAQVGSAHPCDTSQVSCRQSAIFNGKEYLRPSFYINSGIPYYKADSLTRGSVEYDGIIFNDIYLMLDQVEGELITYDFSGKHLVRLVKEKVSKFSIYGAEFISVQGISKNIDGYYEVEKRGNSLLLKKEIKQIKQIVKGDELNRSITSKQEYLVLYNNTYIPASKMAAANFQDDNAYLEKLAKESKQKYHLPVVVQPVAAKKDSVAAKLVEVQYEPKKKTEEINFDYGSLSEGKISVLEDVVVLAQKVNNVKGAQMGVQKIEIKAIKQIPAVLGEADVLRVVTSLPGVKTVGEASTGLNVRGGSADQNLILFNDATIYNPSHFFGMFSAFNPDIVKDIMLYKSSIPARYGGRLSSVLDIGSKEGSKKEFSGSAGIGPLTSRINIEGPLIKEKTSFLFGGRTTYANWLMKLLPDEYENSRASFYDVNLLVSHDFDKNNSLYLTGYFSKDKFSLNSDTTFGYQNGNLSLKWKHTFSNKLSGIFTAGLDNYNYSISSDRNTINSYRLKFGINQYYLKTHFNYYLNSNHTVDFGLNAIKYQLDPGSYEPLNANSLVVPKVMRREHALETAVYLSDKYDVTTTTSLEAGIRYSVFSFLGPQEVNLYTPGVPKDENNFLGTKTYGTGKFINTYGGPEYRISVRQMIGINSSIKAGFNTQRQYIHMLSNTTTMAPTDIWKLSDPNIRPQHGSQVSLGFYRNFKSNTIEASVELYYKKIKDYLDYKSGANLVMNQFIEADVINTNGKAYGVEVLVKKTLGKLNGWVGYTWSRILLKQSDTLVGEIINEGKFYPANYDKPHDFTFIGNYRVNHRFSVSLSATYSTGRPITMPIGRYYYAGSYRTLYDERNAHRIPDYFRSDFSMNIDGNHKKNQKTHNSWTIGVYNVTGRKNPYSVYYVSEGGVINGYKLSIFGSAIPFLSFNIKF